MYTIHTISKFQTPHSTRKFVQACYSTFVLSRPPRGSMYSSNRFKQESSDIQTNLMLPNALSPCFEVYKGLLVYFSPFFLAILGHRAYGPQKSGNYFFDFTAQVKYPTPLKKRKRKKRKRKEKKENKIK